MKDKYDFSNAAQGKFYRPIDKLEIPIYLDKNNREFFMEKIKKGNKNLSLSSIINSLLKKDIEISKKLSY